MDPETANLKSALEQCRDAGMTAIAFLLKDDGGTSYLGPLGSGLCRIVRR